jgi:aminoglycoside phosphotransferase (APT) family kinase protein
MSFVDGWSPMDQRGWPAPFDTDPGAASASYADLSGMPSRSAVLARYAEVSGRQVDDIDYYLILARWKFAVVLEQGYQRAGDDVKLQAFGPMVLELMQGAAALAESTEYRS